jgi:dTDP-4-dehydrorhamnose reductase
MKVLILGATGMLGHKLYQVLAPAFDVRGAIRGHYNDITRYGFFDASNMVSVTNALEIGRLEKVIEEINPQVVVNCIGIIKSVEQAKDRLLSVWVNSLFPHQLYQICKPKKIRLIHISTDCVFSGRRGSYQEGDCSDAEDIYGKSKYLGEISGDWALTIRTSLIGRELSTTNGLVEWFLSNRGGKVNGFSNAIFSGFPTIHFAKIIADVIATYQDLSGIYHVSSEPISKFNLLCLIREKMGLDIEIQEDPDFYCDRSLDSTLFQDKTNFKPLSWEKMTDEFVEDALQYQQWRK